MPQIANELRPDIGNVLKHVATAGLTRFNEFELSDIEFIRNGASITTNNGV
jgi:hypothetical protein